MLARYLNQTKDIGLVLDPNYDVCKVDAYPDANFVEIYVHEKPADPAYVKSRTIFIVKFLDCTVLWVSKLHNDTDILTMEA